MMESEHAPSFPSILVVGLPLQLVIGSDHDKVNCGSTLLGWSRPNGSTATTQKLFHVRRSAAWPMACSFGWLADPRLPGADNSGLGHSKATAPQFTRPPTNWSMF